MTRWEPVRGTWINGPHSGTLATAFDFRAGLLIARDGSNDLRGNPDDFVSAEGISGRTLLNRVLAPPTMEGLRYGAVRESMLFVRSVALYGFGETRAWDDNGDYIVDTGEGSLAVVSFDERLCFSAMVSLDPSRRFDVKKAVRAAPPQYEDLADHVLKLPFLTGGSTGPITALFWGAHDGTCGSCEPWPYVYEFGAEILEFECMDTEEWIPAASNHYRVSPQLCRQVAALAEAKIRMPGSEHVEVPLSAYCQLIPADAPFKVEAEALLEDLIRPGATARTGSVR